MPGRSSTASAKDDYVRARISRTDKREAEAVLATIGLSVSEAFRLMLVRVVAERKLPFEPFVPNEKTIQAMLASRRDEVVEVGHPAGLLASLDAD